ncbi:MAG: tRNA (guanosine(46)-N7)-methyltransferase TrmB [bacterium]|nr:tRNA (guanosine(46)-N7)-methyltransferase TrmB [bacterium]MCP5065747.1 tRNA (guanosine(46)-N7)-methyltransferase TrmB [bacterium]
MARKLKLDIPGPDRRVSVEEVCEKGWEAVFAPDVARPLPLVVELGFGRGEFLRHLAGEASDRAHVGVEISFKRVLKMARRIARGEEGNVRLICGSAERAIREALQPESVSAFWINFPDPWPKKRHHKNRLLQPPFVSQLARRLVSGGRLEIATDHTDYAEAIDLVLAGEPLIENALDVAFRNEVPGRLHTAYELQWRAEGRPLHFWSYRRRSGS